MQAYSVVSVHLAARGCETCGMMKSQLIRSGSKSDRDSFYKLFYERSKQSGPRNANPSFCLITGSFEVQILDDYLDCFPKEDCRVWCYLKASESGGFEALTKCPIGKNSLGKFGKLIAKMLGKKNWDSYTGHCWRRTAATICAEAGLTIPEIKNVTGHRSDTVVQGYIDSSARMKRKASEVLSCSKICEDSSQNSVHFLKR